MISNKHRSISAASLFERSSFSIYPVNRNETSKRWEAPSAPSSCINRKTLLTHVDQAVSTEVLRLIHKLHCHNGCPICKMAVTLLSGCTDKKASRSRLTHTIGQTALGPQAFRLKQSLHSSDRKCCQYCSLIYSYVIKHKWTVWVGPYHLVKGSHESRMHCHISKEPSMRARRWMKQTRCISGLQEMTRSKSKINHDWFSHDAHECTFCDIISWTCWVTSAMGLASFAHSGQSRHSHPRQITEQLKIKWIGEQRNCLHDCIRRYWDRYEAPFKISATFHSHKKSPHQWGNIWIVWNSNKSHSHSISDILMASASP